MLLELVALVATGLFAGAATYITFVEHPARLSCGPALALAQWRPSYARATVMQASLAVVGCSCAVGAYAVGRGLPVLVGGGLLGLVVPFTLLGIMPTNRRLEEPARRGETPETADLLRRWGYRHAVRTGLGLLAFAVLSAHAVGRG
jgi:Domain of unknown function (DUF1772)